MYFDKHIKNSVVDYYVNIIEDFVKTGYISIDYNRGEKTVYIRINCKIH